ncbi:GntR family transcriptional regulator [Heyndrickxia camelliae]|uniref:GntR family transcriptional regulator n=1 Tax=Heyndrickxia camelliae TaxID=1707093 RepID=A0A2N3LPB2_9BACI|nr:GntR family transcriptional regulator [Heyndrickxia camelliae]PKR86394.1 GntR family transcriptional regulator [Heyndrickxia camelliae]
MKLNSSSSLPLYFQLKQNIKEAIDSNVYKPGKKIPNETELCEHYGVSRITVRRALQELVDEGLLERKQGKGTFVSATKITRELITVDGFTDYIKRIGKNPSTRIILSEEVPATKVEAEKLNVKEGSPLLKLVRVMGIEEQPLVIDVAHYSLERFPDLPSFVYKYKSTYDVLKNIYGVVNGSSEKILTVSFATMEEANYLECESGEPLFNIDKILWDSNGSPIHISNYKIPTARAAFSITT